MEKLKKLKAHLDAALVMTQAGLEEGNHFLILVHRSVSSAVIELDRRIHQIDAHEAEMASREVAEAATAKAAKSAPVTKPSQPPPPSPSKGRTAAQSLGTLH